MSATSPGGMGALDALAAATGEGIDAIVWLANRGRFARHYQIAWIAKRHGRRLLEEPRPRLKSVQRVIYRELLSGAPLHDDVMGFRRGRGVLDHARRHAGRRWVVHLDLKDFFASIGPARVAGVFRHLGSEPEFARVLTDLTTTAARLRGPTTYRERRLYAHRHLPQGAPTSPALANLVATRLDRRLAGLALAIEGRYSRYADDLVISCDHHVPWLVPAMAAIAIEEGFAVQLRKTRVMGPGGRQMVTGVVVNDAPGVSRQAREILEATLFNCVRHGPLSQDRSGRGPEWFRAHLEGRVAHARHLNPQQGRRLADLLDRISWAG